MYGCQLIFYLHRWVYQDTPSDLYILVETIHLVPPGFLAKPYPAYQQRWRLYRLCLRAFEGSSITSQKSKQRYRQVLR